MLYDFFQKQVRTSQSAPVQLGGGSIGMMRCSKEVLMTVSVLLARSPSGRFDLKRLPTEGL